MIAFQTLAAGQLYDIVIVPVISFAELKVCIPLLSFFSKIEFESVKSLTPLCQQKNYSKIYFASVRSCSTCSHVVCPSGVNILVYLSTIQIRITVSTLSLQYLFVRKQARKGFRPLSAMKGIGWRNIVGEIFWEEFFRRNFLGRIIWEKFLGGFFWKEFFGRNFLGGIFWEKFFGRNYLFTLWYLNMEGIDLYVKILVFVKILSQWRRKEEENFNP